MRGAIARSNYAALGNPDRRRHHHITTPTRTEPPPARAFPTPHLPRTHHSSKGYSRHRSRHPNARRRRRHHQQQQHHHHLQHQYTHTSWSGGIRRRLKAPSRNVDGTIPTAVNQCAAQSRVRAMRRASTRSPSTTPMPRPPHIPPPLPPPTTRQHPHIPPTTHTAPLHTRALPTPPHTCAHHAPHGDIRRRRRHPRARRRHH